MIKNKLWLIAPALLLLAPSCSNNGGERFLNDCSWAEIKAIANTGKAREHFSIGESKDIIVNGVTHKVRIIGFNQDVDSKGKKIGITFEFENLLSDENGYSLATYWNDVGYTVSEYANFRYTDSTIRAVLNGNDYVGSSKANINWFQFFGLSEDAPTAGFNLHFSTAYTNKSVLSMLPKDLANVLATPSKVVSVYNDDQDKFIDTAIDDKLFLLSPREMGYRDGAQEESTSTYEYYEMHSSYKDEIRIKHQVRWNSGARDNPVAYGNLQGAYHPILGSPDLKYSYAGYNSLGDTKYGGRYWLRSPEPSIYYGRNAWSTYEDGALAYRDNIHVYDNAQGIAPAFCI